MSRIVSIFLLSLAAMLVVCPVKDVWAVEKYTIKEMTPEVTSALENRKARYDELQQLKRQGKIGENNQGYVEAFSAESNVTKIVSQENADRAVIYKTIAQQNDLANALNAIEEIFAQTQRENAEPGDKIQMKDGSWGVK